MLIRLQAQYCSSNAPSVRSPSARLFPPAPASRSSRPLSPPQSPLAAASPRCASPRLLAGPSKWAVVAGAARAGGGCQGCVVLCTLLCHGCSCPPPPLQGGSPPRSPCHFHDRVVLHAVDVAPHLRSSPPLRCGGSRHVGWCSGWCVFDGEQLCPPKFPAPLIQCL